MSFTVVTPSLAVTDFDDSVSWYTKLLGREPDRRPMEGTAEWDVAEGGGLQLSTSTETRAATVIIGVDDVDSTLDALAERAIGEGCESFTVPSGQFKLAMLEDPAGNTVVLSQTLD